MKVLVISQLYPPDMGGGSTRAYNAVKGLARRGHKVTVVAAFPHYPMGDIPRRYRGRLRVVDHTDVADVIRTWVPPTESRGFARRLMLYAAFCISSLLALRLIRKHDVVWAANPNIFSIFPAMIIGKLARIPIVENVDDVWPDELVDLGMLKSPLLQKIAERMARYAYGVPAALTPISQAYVSALVDKYDGHRPRADYRVVPAGVDLESFAPRNGGNGHSLTDPFRVVYIGAFSPAYDFDQLLEAAEQLAPHRDIQFRIQGDGELAPYIADRIRALGLSNVAVVQQVVSRPEVAEILAEADALVLPLGGTPSVEMGISSKLYEYQAAGKPIICCSRGESGAYVTSTRSGVVVTPGDSARLAEAILLLHDDRSAGLTLGKAGRKWVETNLSCDAIGSLMEGVLEDARGRRAS